MSLSSGQVGLGAAEGLEAVSFGDEAAEGLGAVAAHPHRGDDPGLGHLDARRPQRRVAGQRGRGQGVEGKLHRVQAEGGEVCQEISGGTHVKRGEGGGGRRRHEQQQGTTKSRINSEYVRTWVVF